MPGLIPFVHGFPVRAEKIDTSDSLVSAASASYYDPASTGILFMFVGEIYIAGHLFAAAFED